jgi:AP-1-like factor
MLQCDMGNPVLTIHSQRAFRERKERHVKDLETKLNSLSAHSNTLLSDNERLKRELQRLATQNEILRATSQPTPAPARSPSPVHGPQTYSPTDFATATGIELHGRPMSYEDFGGDNGQRLLAAGATWDLIQSHELFKRGMVDVSDVCMRLKGRAVCDGRGPSFREAQVLRAIEESVMSGSDELI